MLIEHPGEVVLREEIRQKLWPDNTVVEFDHSINTAIQRLREVLGDSAEDPRYIETLAGRGYRFLATVDVIERPQPAPAAPQEHLAEPRPAQPPARSRKARILQTVAFGLLGAIALAAWIRPLFQRTPPPNWVVPLGEGRSAVPSPDGRAVLYRSGGLFLRRMDSPTATPIYSDSPLVDSPVWSPDGTQALFQTIAGLIRMPIPSGPPVIIWPNRRVTRGYSWGPQGDVLVAVLEPNGSSDLYLIPAGNGSPARLEIPQLPSGIFYEPEFLPEAGKFLFTFAAQGEAQASIFLATLKQRNLADAPVLLRRNVSAGHFGRAGGDHLLYVQNDTLYAQTLNWRKAVLEGAPKPVVEDVLSTLETRHAFFSVSRNGMLVWRPGKANLVQLTWFDRHGKVLGTTGPPSEPSAIVLSPDENHVLLTIADRFGALLDPHQSAYTPLPDLARGVWMQDSARILHAPKGGSRLLERDLARGTDRMVAQVPDLGTPLAISPDGKVLLYSARLKIYSLRLDEPSGSAQPQVAIDEDILKVGFSPDGHWLVYSRLDRTVRRSEVFVKPFAFPGLSRQISVDGGHAPVWRADGKEILFWNGTTIYCVRVAMARDQISASAPEALFDVRVPPGLVGDSVPLAVVRDGSRILFTQAMEGAGSMMNYVTFAWDRLPAPLRAVSEATPAKN